MRILRYGLVFALVLIVGLSFAYAEAFDPQVVNGVRIYTYFSDNNSTVGEKVTSITNATDWGVLGFQVSANDGCTGTQMYGILYNSTSNPSTANFLAEVLPAANSTEAFWYPYPNEIGNMTLVQGAKTTVAIFYIKE